MIKLELGVKMIRFMRELFSQFRHKIRPVDEKQIIAQWSKLHENGYHPGVKEIVERIQTSRTSEKSGWIELFEKNGLLVPELSGKVFGEKGHGGGWYLAEALDAGAKKAIGWEINANLNSQASNALTPFSNHGIQSSVNGQARLRKNKSLGARHLESIIKLDLYASWITKNTK